MLLGKDNKAEVIHPQPPDVCRAGMLGETTGREGRSLEELISPFSASLNYLSGLPQTMKDSIKGTITDVIVKRCRKRLTPRLIEIPGTTLLTEVTSI